jgi:hypothetical protein
MFTLRQSLRFAACLAAASLAAHAAAQDAPSPGEVYVESFAANGNGCPAGTVSQNLSPDAKALTLLFSDFGVTTDARGGRPKKSCNINLRLHVPQGWVYTLFSVDYRGYVALDEDSEARLRSWYSLDGGQQIRISNLKVEGPLNQDFQQRAWVPLDALPWLQCNRPSSSINIATELMVDGDNAMLTVDSIDGELKQRC